MIQKIIDWIKSLFVEVKIMRYKAPINDYKLWSSESDYVLINWKQKDKMVAKKLGRTVRAIQQRRCALKKLGRK